MSSYRCAVPLAGVALLLAIAPAAQAKLPAPKVKTVVFGKSVAGIKLGTGLAAAKAAWGSGSKCGPAALGPSNPATQCTWSTTPGAKPDLGAKLTLVARKGKVVAITIDDGTGGTKAGIKKFRTSKGIGLGASIAALRKAYPAVPRANGNPSAANTELGSGKTVTSFFFENDKLTTFTVGSPY